MHTLWIGSTTVARFLEGNLGNIVVTPLLVEIARLRALEEEHFNMVAAMVMVMVGFGDTLVQPPGAAKYQILIS
jgi:hypothetical protein